MLKLAGKLEVGDKIFWDGSPATVEVAEPFETAKGHYVEFIVRGETFQAAAVLNAGDAVRVVPSVQEMDDEEDADWEMFARPHRVAPLAKD